MLNSIALTGRLTRDPELRYTQNQTPVASFCVACERDFPDKSTGERATDFINCVAWRQTAEFVSKWFSKGNLITMIGRLQMREYTDRDGNKRVAAEILADHVYFAESKRRDDKEAPAAKPAGAGVDVSAEDFDGGRGAFAVLDDDGDLPF